MSNQKLESNRLSDPRANFFQLVLCIFFGWLILTWIYWTCVVVLGNNLHRGYEKYKDIDPIKTALTPWTTNRGLFATDILGMVLYVVICVLIYYLFWGRFRKIAKEETRVDSYSRSMGFGKAISGISEATCRKKANRLLKLEHGQKALPGIRLGKLVYNNETVYSDWEAEMLVVAGPRTGKTTGFVIPSIVYAPGPCIATANKRDIVDATKSLVEEKGRKTWLFDPENIASGQPTWYWNPVDSIRNLDDAQRIANCWRSAAGIKKGGDGNSEFFNGSATDQIANYLYAASLEDLSLKEVFKWCQDDKDDTPAKILVNYEYNVIANSVYGVLGITPETRSGIFAVMKKIISFVVDEKLDPWISKNSSTDPRPSFDPYNFALSSDTLYLLSQKDSKSTPITAALTAVTARAAYEISQEMGGRLPLPLLGVLDECANVCPWPELPEIYSYYGSCGIILMSFFQNVSQGVIAFEENGFKSLFDNANTFVYLGGNKDDKFLPQLSTLIGQRDILSHQVSDNDGFANSETRNLRQDKIFSEQQLAEWPEFRGLVLSSQNRATIVKTVPWFKDKSISSDIEKALAREKEKIKINFNLEDLKMKSHHKKSFQHRAHFDNTEIIQKPTLEEQKPEYSIDANHQNSNSLESDTDFDKYMQELLGNNKIKDEDYDTN